MSFNRTLDALEKCSNQDKIYIDDILDLITEDIFYDIQDSQGTTMDALPVRNDIDFIMALNSLTMFARRSFKNNKDLLTDEGKAALWEKENAKISKFAGDIDSLINDLRDLQEKQKKAQSEIKDKTIKKNASQQEWNKASAELADLEDQISLYTEQVRETGRKAEDAGRQINQLKEEVTLASGRLQNLEEERDQEKARKLKIDEAVREASALLDTATNERIIAGIDLDTIRQQLSEVEAERDRLKEKTAGVESTVREYKAQIDEYRRLADDTEGEINRLKEAAGIAANTVENLKNDRDKEIVNKQNFEKEVLKAAALLRAAEGERDAEREKRDKTLELLKEVEAERDRLITETSDFEEDKRTLQGQIDNLKAQKQKTHDENITLEQNIEELKESIDSDERRINDQRKEYNEYRKKHVLSKQKLNVHVIDYQKLVEDYKKEQDYYGGLISGFMGDSFMMDEWSFAADKELQSSLENMKNELDSLFKKELTVLSKFLSGYDID